MVLDSIFVSTAYFMGVLIFRAAVYRHFILFPLQALLCRLLSSSCSQHGYIITWRDPLAMFLSYIALLKMFEMFFHRLSSL